MNAAFDDLHCEYGYASGRTFDHCSFIGRRWRDAYGTMLSDSDFFVLCNRAAANNSTDTSWWGPWPNIVTSLWVSPEGTTYAGDASQQSVHIWADVTQKSKPARVEELWFAPEGLWGLDDAHLFAFGTGMNDARDRIHPVAQYDGRVWHEIPSPGFVVSKLHGVAPDLIYAGGRGGGMARWDGKGWTAVDLPVEEVVSDVFVAAPDEVYATTLNGALFENRGEGWRLITRTPDRGMPFSCVAKFADTLFVGALFVGMFRRLGAADELDHFKPNIKAINFEARENLIISTPNAIVGTADGEGFMGAAINTLHNETNTVDIAQ